VKAAFGKILIWVFAAWFVYVSWRVAPHFSEGFEAGQRYYRIEAVRSLDDLAAAFSRISQPMKTKWDAIRSSEDAPVTGTAGRFRDL
jgi:hypothetical protein